MNQILCVAASISVLAFAQASAGESPAFAQDGYWSCQSIQADNTVYITPLFEIQPGMQEVRGAFAQALYDKFAFKGQVTCSIGDRLASSRETIEAGRQAQITAWKSAGTKVIELPWAYTPATSLRYFCSGGTRVVTPTERTNVFYTSPNQKITAAQIDKLQTAWAGYLQTLHPYVEMKGCQLVPADPANEQSMKDYLEQDWKAKNGRITHTTWTFAPAVE